MRKRASYRAVRGVVSGDDSGVSRRLVPRLSSSNEGRNGRHSLSELHSDV